MGVEKSVPEAFLKTIVDGTLGRTAEKLGSGRGMLGRLGAKAGLSAGKDTLQKRALNTVIEAVKKEVGGDFSK